MPQTLHEKLDSLGAGQVRTLDEIERSSRETSIMNRSIRESLAGQTEALRIQTETLRDMNRQMRESREEARRHDARQDERAAREAKLAREHQERMKAFEARSEAQHEMFRLAMVQLLDRINAR